MPAVSRTCRLQRLHWNSSRVFSWQKPLVPAGRAGQPLAPAHLEQCLAAGLLGPEPLPERGLAQALERTPQARRHHHPPPPPAPKALEILAHRRMRVMGNQETDYSSCAVGRNRISLMSTSSGWLMAKSTMRRRSRRESRPSRRSPGCPRRRPASVMLCGSSDRTAPGEMIVVRMLYGFTSCRSPSEITRTAVLVAAVDRAALAVPCGRRPTRR